MSLVKKLLGINIWNGLYSFFNFLSNYLIVQTLGVTVFGEFSILSVYIALAGLIFIVIPSNAAIFEYQDNPKFKHIYFTYFSYLSFFYALLILCVGYFIRDEVNVSIWYFIMYALSLMWFNYLDVTYQAKGNLKAYFMLLGLSAIIKCLVIVVFYWFKELSDINDLLLAMMIAQVTTLAYALRKDEAFRLYNLLKFKLMLSHVKQRIAYYMPYYFNTALKRIQDQSSVFLFNFFISKEQLGLFALLMKTLTFVTSLLRIIEAYFVNRTNFEEGFDRVKSKQLMIALIAQLLFIVFAQSYMYLMLGQFYTWEIIILSFSLLLYVSSLLSRAQLLSDYKMGVINLSQIIYIITTIGLVVLFKYTIGLPLVIIVTVYVLANGLQQSVLVFKNKLYVL